MSNILITRSKEDNKNLAKLIKLQGNKPVDLPFYEIKYSNEIEERYLYQMQGHKHYVIVSSINAVRALARISSSRKFNIITISAASQQEITKLGYRNVINSNCLNAQTMADYIYQEFNNKNCFFSYITTEDMAFDIEKYLKNKNPYLKVKTHFLYQKRKILYDEEILSKTLERIDCITLFSVQSALYYQEYLEHLINHNIKIITLSKNIAKPLQIDSRKNIIACEEPSIIQMLALI